MLFPKENKKNHQLMYVFRRCNHEQIAEGNCVYSNVIKHDESELTVIIRDIASDPTLPHSELFVLINYN
jgi:DNA-directed RNA polymerase II subunit RPB9